MNVKRSSGASSCPHRSCSWCQPTAVVSMMPYIGVALRDAALPVAIVLTTLS